MYVCLQSFCSRAKRAKFQDEGHEEAVEERTLNATSVHAITTTTIGCYEGVLVVLNVQQVNVYYN